MIHGEITLAAVNKFIGSSLFLFFDNIIVTAGNWIFWLVVSNLTGPSAVGQATVVISLATFLTTITQLGMEYPLLRQTSVLGVKIIGPSLIISVGLAAATLPFMTYISMSMYHNSVNEFMWVATVMICLSPVDFVSRYSLMGTSRARVVSLIDTTGVITKFALGYALLSIGWGAYGILISVLSHVLVMSVANLITVNKSIGIRFRPIIWHIYKSMLSQSLVNAPSKFSGILIFSLSVVLLASYGIDSSDIGRFYISLMITVAGGAMLTNMAYMIIPASTVTKTDLSIKGLRIGISLTSPVISALLASPGAILFLLGRDYLQAAPILTVLAIGMLPFSVVFTSISKFNYLNKPKRIIFLGALQILAFLTSFVFLVPVLGSMGAAYSIVIAFGVSFAITLFWIEKALLKYIMNSIFAIVVGAVTGYGVSYAMVPDVPGSIYGLVAAVSLTSLLLLVLKNTTIEEIYSLFRIAIKQASKGSS